MKTFPLYCISKLYDHTVVEVLQDRKSIQAIAINIFIVAFNVVFAPLSIS